MEEVAKEFIDSFHNLAGITTSQKKRSLYRLFHSHPEILSNPELQDLITMELTAQSHCERVFLVEYLIHYRRIAELIKEFQSGNEIIINKLSTKDNWFFKAAFQQITPEFVNQILPQLPYNIRIKILKKIVLVVDQRQNDNIFDLLLARYGIFMATNILVGCSPDKITETIRNYNILLSTSQLKLLYGKGAGLLEIYFDERIKQEGNKFLVNNTIFRFIATRSIDDFCKYLEKYDFETRLGKHTTEKFVEAKRSVILSNPERYVKNLNAAVLVKKLRGEDFVQVYKKLFPKSVQAHPAGQACRLLKHYPKKRQFELLQTTFNQTFHKKLQESPLLIDEKIMKMAPSNELREQLALIKWGDDSDDSLLYLTTRTATDKIKKKFNFARYPYERGQLVNQMAVTCLINDDYDALLQVSEYITQRLKNDYITVQQSFLTALLQCDFERLTDRHWTYIREIFARPDFQTMYDYHLKPFFYRSLEFLIKNGHEIREEILRFFKQKSLDLYDWECLKVLQPATVKQFLSDFIPLLPEITQDYRETDCTLVLLIKKHNTRSSAAKLNISDFPRLFESVTSKVLSEKLKTTDLALSETVEYLICRDECEETEKLTELYWSNVTLIQPFGMKWFLHYRPEKINAENLLSAGIVQPKSSKIWHLVRNYHQHALTIMKFCQQNLKNAEYQTPEKLILPLSVLMKPADFVKLAESYVPVSGVAEVHSEAENRRFRVLKQIVKCLSNVNCPSEALLVINKFNTGELSQFCVDSLYNCTCKLPEIDCKQFTEALLAKEEKHALNLIALLLDQATVMKHVKSSKLEGCARVALLYFLRNAVQGNWEILAEKLKNTNAKGSFLKRLALKTVVARRFRLDYTEIVWGLLEMGEKKTKSVFLANLDDFSIENMHSSLFEKLLTFEENEENIIFTSKYAVFHRNEATLAAFPMNKRFLARFSASFAENYMKYAVTDAMFIAKLSERIIASLGCSETFQELATVQLLKFKGERPEAFARSVINLYCDIVSIYGEFVTVLLAKVLKEKLSLFLKTDLDSYKFYYFLVIHRQIVSNVLLALKLLPSDSQPEDRESFEFYSKTLDEIERIDVVSVELFLNLHFKQLKAEEPFAYYKEVTRCCVNTSSWTSPKALRRKVYY